MERKFWMRFELYFSGHNYNIFEPITQTTNDFSIKYKYSEGFFWKRAYRNRTQFTDEFFYKGS